jgi:hypothetical protein
MLIEVKIRLTSPVVADTWDHSRHMFSFPREGGAWELGIQEKTRWRGRFINAIESLGMTTDPDTLRFPNAILLPSLSLFTRKSTRSFKSSPEKNVRHEAIDRRTVLTFVMMLRVSAGEERLKYPTLDELKSILEFIGTYEGISPFGSTIGLGQFSVESVCPMGRHVDDDSQLPAGVSEGARLHDEGDADCQLPTEDRTADCPPLPA